METRVLRYFIAVANQKSISGAAKVLHLSQPSLSRQIADLEKQLGCTLFTRGNREISLTEDGMYLLKKAKEIIELVDKTEDNFQESTELISGDIYIGCGETEAMRFIGKTLKKLVNKYPLARFHLYSGNADDITAKIDSGHLDFGVVIEPADKQKYDFIQLPAKDVWGLLMRKESPLADRAAISPEDLEDQPLLVSRQTAVGNEISGWLGKNFDDFNIVATYNLIYNAALMVEENIGYALCLDKLVNTSGDSSLTFRPLYPELAAGLNFIWKKHQAFSSASEKFLEILRDDLEVFNSESL